MENSESHRVLSYEENVELLSKYGIPVARGGVAPSLEEATRIARNIGYPVALKVISPQVTHKSDVNAIRLDVTEPVLAECYEEVLSNARKLIPQAQIQGVLIQEIVRNGTEVIVGVSRDPLFGPTIMFGLGGIFVELLKDVSIRVPPLARYDAEEMIKEIKGYGALLGFRGRPKVDIESVVNILLNISRLAIDLKESIVEMDLNPLIVLPEGQGAKAVDIRTVVQRT